MSKKIKITKIVLTLQQTDAAFFNFLNDKDIIVATYALVFMPDDSGTFTISTTRFDELHSSDNSDRALFDPASHLDRSKLEIGEAWGQPAGLVKLDVFREAVDFLEQQDDDVTFIGSAAMLAGLFDRVNKCLGGKYPMTPNKKIRTEDEVEITVEDKEPLRRSRKIRSAKP